MAIASHVDREGQTLTAAAFNVTFTPAAETLFYTLSANHLDRQRGGNGTVNVAAGTGCAWTASQCQLITIQSGATGTGNGTVSFNAAANTLRQAAPAR